MNISGIVVLTKQENLEKVIRQIKKADYCEYHLHSDEGKIIVTIEGESVSDEIAALKKIKQIPGVIAADMVYSYAEDELDRERDKLESDGTIPVWLNNNEADIRDIKYGGDLRGKSF
jgi:nitrate reductase NapD